MNLLNGVKFQELLASGANNLANHSHEVDALNVFPVPDGDTGTNMSMTFTSGTNDALQVSENSISLVAKKLSKGLLMGARGNSGVILSQIFRGFYQAVDGNDEINVVQLANAFENGTKVAYKAVMRPVEGTILTVVRESSWYANKYVGDHSDISIEEYFDKLIEYAHDSLANTPELLPVLKEVGVVDSGGTGLVTILEGFKHALDGNPDVLLSEKEEKEDSKLSTVENEEFGYCTEFIIRLNPDKLHTFKEEILKDLLGKLGNSIVCVQDEELVKVHVHTLTPGEALNIAQRYGEFVKIKVENMQEQHNNIITEQEQKAEVKEAKEYAIISVCAGEGLTNLFKEYRSDIVISGGQTMNPSTEDFVGAIKKLNAKHILILPNNSNIILAAKQAKDILEDIDIHVIETKSIPQGLAASIMFNPEDDIETNLREMNDAVSRCKTGQLTYAIKDTSFDGLTIKAGDFMGMFEKNIVISTPDKKEALKKLLDTMIHDDDYEIITVISGEDATEEEIEFITSYIEENSELEIDLQKGDQPVYSFIFGIE